MAETSKAKGIIKTAAVYFLMVAIACAAAVCYQIFIFENSFAPAGINGIATMIQYKLNFSVAYMSLLINIPLCVLAFVFLNKSFAARTTVFAITFSAALLLLQFKIIDLSFWAIVINFESSKFQIIFLILPECPLYFFFFGLSLTQG